MTKIHKQKRKKTFRHTVNRKKLNKRKKRLPKITCDAVKYAWDDKASVKQNLADMGLSSDPNVTMPFPKVKDSLMPPEPPQVAPEVPRVKGKAAPTPPPRFPKLAVAKELEAEAATRKRKVLRLSQMQVDRLGYFVHKYNNDYRAMTKDRLNYDQHTWRQLRMQIKKFMSCKEQWEEYWKSLDHPEPQRCVILEEDEDSN